MREKRRRENNRGLFVRGAFSGNLNELFFIVSKVVRVGISGKRC